MGQKLHTERRRLCLNPSEWELKMQCLLSWFLTSGKPTPANHQVAIDLNPDLSV